MSLFDVVLGKPLATSAENDEHIGVAAGIPIFGLDGLTSAAYGPEAAMSLIIPLGLWGRSAFSAAHLQRDSDLTGHCVLQLSANNHRLPKRRRVLHDGD